MGQVAERGGFRRPLNRRRILEAAIRLVDREGLEALSMRKLGRELGVEAMSLYNHVPNKAALLDGMVGAVLGELAVPPADPAHWEDRLRAVARAYRRLARVHPNLFPALVTRPLNAPEVLRPLEATLDILLAAGFDAPTTLRAFRALSSYVEGYVLDELTGFSFAADAPGDGPPLELDRLDPRAFPRIRELAPHFAEQDRDAEFEFGLDALIVGLRAALAADGKRATRRPRGSEAPVPDRTGPRTTDGAREAQGTTCRRSFCARRG